MNKDPATSPSESPQLTPHVLTRDDLARLAGVSSCTVSMAMRNSPKVAAATRRRIQQLAAETGYVVNPVGALLARRRVARRRPEARILIAVLSEFDRFNDSLRNAAAAMGVDLLPVRVDSDVTPQVILDRLWAQGVHGILLGDGIPWSRETFLAADWGRFSVLRGSRLYPFLPFHFISHAPFDYAMLALENLHLAGCRRIGAILADSGSRMDDDNRLGAIHAFTMRHKDEGVCTAIRTERNVGEISAETRQWLREWRPEGVLVFHAHMVVPLREAGFAIPGDFLCAAILAMPPYMQEVAGCDVRYSDYSRLEIRTLMNMVGIGDRGFAEAPVQHVLNPVWHAGATCPASQPMAFLS